MTKKQKLAVGISSSFLVVVLVVLSLVSSADPIAGDPILACKPDTWVKRANFGGLGRQGPFGFSVGTKGYIGGGSNSTMGLLSDFWEYDSGTNKWTQKADFGGGKRTEATGFSIGSKGYAGTGFWTTPTNNIRYTKDFWEYNPATNIWTKKADFGGAQRTGAVGFSIGNKGYLGMGDASPANGIIFKDFYEYNPKLNTWTKKADYGGGEGANHTGFVMNGKGYIQHSVNFQEYDPATNKWTEKANFPLQYLNTQVGFAIGKNGYVGGGNNAGTLTKDFWMYCPGVVN